MQIAELKERNADLNQQLELSELQVQQITDKYKSHVEKKVKGWVSTVVPARLFQWIRQSLQLEHETVRRGGLSVSSMDSDGGLEYENRQLKDQITTLKCEVAHWKEVLKAQVSYDHMPLQDILSDFANFIMNNSHTHFC